MANQEPLRIRIQDHAERLTRLNSYHDQRAIDEDQIIEELDRVCSSIWGYTADDIDDDLISAADHQWFEKSDEADAVEFAESRGYDLYYQGTFNLLPDWGCFLWMILAEARGILTPENKAAVKLKRDAEAFIENKTKGVINGS